MLAVMVVNGKSGKILKILCRAGLAASPVKSPGKAPRRPVVAFLMTPR
jgi:hypothetical protein